MRMHHLLTGIAIAAALAGPARAGVTTIISDATDDIAYYGNGPTGWFGGSDQGDVIGNDFDTSKIVVKEKDGKNGALKLTFKLYTQFGGTDCFGSTCAYYADLFLRTPSSGYSALPFNYAITLGDQKPNGGYSKPGLYSVTSYVTSQDIWSSRGGFIYGGAYVPDNDSAAPESAPTVLTSGTLLDHAKVHQHHKGNDGYVEDISLTVTGQAALDLSKGFDVLWGTGDCANDAVFGSVPSRVPEPGTVGLFAAGLLGLLAFRRKAAAIARRR